MSHLLNVPCCTPAYSVPKLQISPTWHKSICQRRRSLSIAHKWGKPVSPYKNPWAVLWWKVTSGTGETFPAFGIYSDTLVPGGSMSQLGDNFSWNAQGVRYPLVTVIESVIQLFFLVFIFMTSFSLKEPMFILYVMENGLFLEMLLAVFLTFAFIWLCIFFFF